MKKKTILSIAFIISLLPMLFNQYGGLKGVQEIAGLINLQPYWDCVCYFVCCGCMVSFQETDYW